MGQRIINAQTKLELDDKRQIVKIKNKNSSNKYVCISFQTKYS